MRYWPGFGRSSPSRAFGSSSASTPRRRSWRAPSTCSSSSPRIELLDLGRSGPGLLNSAVGIGGIIGAAVALGLVGLRRSRDGVRVRARALGASRSSCSAPGRKPPRRIVFLGLLGVGNTLVDVSGLTLLQRTAPEEVLGRVFGVLESLVVGTLGLGAIIAPLLVSLFGVRWALVATGLLLPALALVSWARLRKIDERTVVPERELELLRSLPLFAPLPRRRSSISPGASCACRRRPGRRSRARATSATASTSWTRGTWTCSIDGEVVSTLGPGDHFGEIALLRDVPRTATVTARTDASLLALERDEFVSAVSGHPASREAADAVVAARLGRLRPGLASI